MHILNCQIDVMEGEDWEKAIKLTTVWVSFEKTEDKSLIPSSAVV